MKANICEALKQANHWNRHQALKAAHRSEWRLKSKRQSVESEMRTILRPAVREARRIFRQEACPVLLRRYVDIYCGGDVDHSISFDYLSYNVDIYFSYTILCFGFELKGHFAPKNLADCQIEGWRVWGIIKAMLMANISKLPEAMASKLQENE